MIPSKPVRGRRKDRQSIRRWPLLLVSLGLFVACSGGENIAMGTGTGTGPAGDGLSPVTGLPSTGTGTGTDSDGDGVPDTSDAFPANPNEHSDRDGDGVGDNADAYPDDPGRSLAPIAATRRAGQTFVTWVEDDAASGEKYHVYRHDQPITSANLATAKRLTQRWGALPEGTAVNGNAGTQDPKNFVIRDLDSPLPDGIGLFVHTTQPGESAQAYYAVTEVVGGVERTDIVAGVNSLSTPVSEAVQPPSAVFVQSRNRGLGRLYTQFMDYEHWNPTLNGYAYNYAVGLPENFDPSRAYPIKLELHAYGGSHRRVDAAEFGWPAIQVLPDDPGGTGSAHTWWYGFARNHDYRQPNTVPTNDVIVNFTEQRVLRILDELMHDPQIKVDPTRTHAWGHSMGASGSLSLGIRYGAVFAGIYASEPMTNYATSPVFIGEFERLWGRRADNLPIANEGPDAAPIARYGEGGDAPTGVWDWMDHGRQLQRRRGEAFAFLMFGHGKDDRTIDWATQGRPFIAQLDSARAAFSSIAQGGWDHTWMAFAGVNHAMFSRGYTDLGDYAYPATMTWPALHRATASGPLLPGDTGTDHYNLDIEWSTPWNSFASNPVDSADRYEISLRSTVGNQTVDVTPRNTSAFKPRPGELWRWRVTAGFSTLAQGSSQVDGQGLLTIPGVPVPVGGSRLIIER
ncbi:MAG: alpha/beta hydrolase-fold protein [Burkholderiaceae bacterium]